MHVRRRPEGGSLVVVQPAARRILAVDLARRHLLVLVRRGVVLYAMGPVFLAASDAAGPVL